MPLNEQNLIVRFAAGVDTRSDEKLVVPGVLTDSENGVFKKNGTISKRNGYESFRAEKNVFGTLPQPISAGNALGLYTRQGNTLDELIMLSSGTLYTRVGNAWFDRGHVTSTNVKTSTVVHNTGEQTRPSTALVNRIAVTSYQDSRGGVRARVWSTETGATIQSDQVIDSDPQACEPRSVVIGQFVLVFYRIGQLIKFKRLNTYDPSVFDFAGTVWNDLRSWHPFWEIRSMGDRAVFAYTRDYTEFSVNYLTRVGFLTADGTMGSFGSGLPAPIDYGVEPTRGGLALSPDPKLNDRFALAWWQQSVDEAGQGVLLSTLFSSSLQISLTHQAIQTIDTGWQELSGNLRNIAIGWQSSTTSATGSTSAYCVAYTVHADISSSSDAYVKVGSVFSKVLLPPLTESFDTVATGSVLLRSVSLMSDGLTQNTSSYFFACHDSPQQPTNFVFRDDGKVVARSVYGLAGGHYSASLNVSGTTLDSPKRSDSNTHVWASSLRVAFESASGTLHGLRGVGNTELVFDDARSSYSQAQLGQSLLLGGGVASSYDGDSTTEHGFLLAPELPEDKPFLLGSGGNMANGTYQYSAVYVWKDASGQRVLSAPSTPLTQVLNGAQNCVTASVPACRLTAKRSTGAGDRADCKIELYRTQDGLPVFYKVAEADNDPNVDYVKIVDVSTDTQISSNLPLYTEGGLLECFPPEACSIIWVGKNRLFCSGLETNPYRVLYSKERVEDEQPSFHPTLFFDVDPRYGKVTAGATVDDKTVVFTERGIHVVFGEGPLDSGEQNDFSKAQAVNTDVGCVDQRSVALVPDGVVFKSEKGIRLLDRNLQVSPIGNPMQAYDSDTVVAADLVQDRDQVRFLLAGGKALVYDYVRGQWLPWSNHVGAVDSAVWNGRYVWLKSTGEVWAETEGKYLDAGSGIPMSMTTANLRSPEQTQTEIRVRKLTFLGEYRSPHLLSIEAAYDWSESFFPATQWDVTASLSVENFYGSGSYYGADDPYGGSGDLVYQVTRSPTRQRCQAIRLKIRDVGATGDAFTLSELQMSYGTEGKHAKLPTRKKV